MPLILNDNISFWKSYSYKSDCEIEFIDVSNPTQITIRYSIKTNSSSYFKDYQQYKKFGYIFEVISGSWLGEQGRWKTEKVIHREICFTNCKEIQKSNLVENDFFQIQKTPLTNNSNVTISNASQGAFSFKCSDIVFNEFYKVFLHDKIIAETVDMTDYFEGMNFVGDLLPLY